MNAFICFQWQMLHKSQTSFIRETNIGFDSLWKSFLSRIPGRSGNSGHLSNSWMALIEQSTWRKPEFHPAADTQQRFAKLSKNLLDTRVGMGFRPTNFQMISGSERGYGDIWWFQMIYEADPKQIQSGSKADEVKTSLKSLKKCQDFTFPSKVDFTCLRSWKCLPWQRVAGASASRCSRQTFHNAPGWPRQLWIIINIHKSSWWRCSYAWDLYQHDNRRKFRSQKSDVWTDAAKVVS